MAIAYTLLSIIRSVYRCSLVNARTVKRLGTVSATHGRASNQKGQPRGTLVTRSKNNWK